MMRMFPCWFRLWPCVSILMEWNAFFLILFLAQCSYESRLYLLNNTDETLPSSLPRRMDTCTDSQGPSLSLVLSLSHTHKHMWLKCKAFILNNNSSLEQKDPTRECASTQAPARNWAVFHSLHEIQSRMCELSQQCCLR